VPLTHRGRISFQVENCLAAIAAAWSLGIPMEVIRTRVDSFAANLEQSPGRFNVLEANGATIIIDYGHNSSALTALIEAIEKFPHQRRTIVYSTAGDRRDCDIVRQGEIIGEAFDRVILFEDHYLRGRVEGEIIGLFRQGLSKATRAREITEIRGAIPAVELGLSSVQPGELLLVQADTIDETVQYMERYLKALAARRAAEAKADKPAAAPVTA
jgi:cyanophycin synthetase